MRIILLSALLLLAGCGGKKEVDTSAAVKPGHHEGTVLEIIPSAGYIYLNVQEADSTFWISTQEAWVKPGAVITFVEDIWMKDFRSEVLDKTFDRILFVNDFSIKDAGKLDESKQVVSDLNPEKALDAGTITISELYGHRQEYAGKKVSIAGDVIKVSENILDNNWVHISDGSDEENSRIIFVSPDQTAMIGDRVVATGIVVLDKDLGFGYFYDILVENSTFLYPTN